MLQEFQNEYAVITDTSCFILLDKIDAFPVLHKLYTQYSNYSRNSKRIWQKASRLDRDKISQ